MRVDLHINFSGQCQNAFEFYQSVVGGELVLLTYGNSPAGVDVPADWQEKIVHGSIKFNGLDIAGADILPESYEKPQGFHLLLQLDSESESKRIFNVLAENGSVTMPMQKTFWSPCFGIVVDKFGISWEINYAED